MIEVTDLTKTFRSGDTTVTAVKDVSFSVPLGKFVSVIGKSGSGKSTLLSLLGALDRPSEGSIKIAGHDIATLSESSLVTYLRKQIGFVFQAYNLIPNLTALENVMLPMYFNGVFPRVRRRRAMELLDQ